MERHRAQSQLLTKKTLDYHRWDINPTTREAEDVSSPSILLLPDHRCRSSSPAYVTPILRETTALHHYTLMMGCVSSKPVYHRGRHISTPYQPYYYSKPLPPLPIIESAEYDRLPPPDPGQVSIYSAKPLPPPPDPRRLKFCQTDIGVSAKERVQCLKDRKRWSTWYMRQVREMALDDPSNY